MIRNLKALGLALVAVFAMSALSASAASASNDVFTITGAEKALLTGVSHDNHFEAGASSFDCTTSRFAGTADNNASVATAEALYSGTVNVSPHTAHCTSSTGSVTVDMNGCHYKLTGSTTGDDLSDGTTAKDATIWVECPGEPITITAPLGVELTIPSQTPTEGGVTYDNVTHQGKHGVKVTATATGITYNCHPHLACTFAGLQTHANDGKYTGSVTVTAYKDNEGLPTPVTEGEKVDVTVSTKA